MAALGVVRKVKESVSRAKAETSMHEVEFSHHAPEAKLVCISGKFNEWNTSSLPMKKGKDGTWRIKLKLQPGKHEYKYIVDGIWAQDIPCTDVVLNSFGTYNCVVAVQ